jgi:hypothetical protein
MTSSAISASSNHAVFARKRWKGRPAPSCLANCGRRSRPKLSDAMPMRAARATIASLRAVVPTAASGRCLCHVFDDQLEGASATAGHRPNCALHTARPLRTDGHVAALTQRTKAGDGHRVGDEVVAIAWRRIPELAEIFDSPLRYTVRMSRSLKEDPRGDAR